MIGIGPDQIVWQASTAGPDGRPPTITWTELASGLTYFDDAQQRYAPTVEAFEIDTDGSALARRGPHRVRLQPNLRSWGAVSLTSQGATFRSHLLGLAYSAPATGQSVLIAEPQDRIGVLASANQLLWEDAFKGVRANVRVTYSKAGVEADVVLLEAPPPPRVFGLPEDARLEVWHEIVDSPALAPPEQPPATNQAPATAVSGSARDADLALGSLVLGQGRAFSLGSDPAPATLPALQTEGVTVQKTLQTLDGRSFLIEAVDYQQIRASLDALPAAPLPADEGASLPGVRASALAQAVRPTRVFPPAPPRREAGGAIHLAQVTRPDRGFVLDYALLNSSANVTLQGDTTYHVSGNAILTGVTTLEPTVIKFSVGAQIQIRGSLRCLTSPFNPAILTGYDDNSCGEPLPSSTGHPWTTYYAANALGFDDHPSDLRHVRILHAQQGVYYDADTGGPHFLSHVQFLHCQKAVVAQNTTVQVRNALMQDVGTAFYGTSPSQPATVHLEHLTATNVTTFQGASQLTLNVTNSLLVNVGTVGTVNAGFCVINPNPSTVFEACAAGHYYLPMGSPYVNAGTPHISWALKRDFALMTTEAPALLNGAVSSALTLAPEVWRDTDLPDLGWHYPAVDQMVSNVVLSAALTLQEGVVLALNGSYGFQLNPGASVISEGTVPELNRLVHYQAVQEQPQTWSVASILSLPSSTLPVIRLRLTEVAARPGSKLALLETSAAFQRFELLDCQFRRARVSLCPAAVSGNVPLAGLTNNLLERCEMAFYHQYYALNTPITVRLFNNLFLGGTLTLGYDASGTNPTWEVKDNLLDGNYQQMSGGAYATYIQRSHNAWTSGTANTLGGSPAYTGLSRDYQGGPLGDYYYPPSAASPSLGYLVGRGSRSAAGTVGLFHHTTQVSQEKEQNSALDIGFHFLAVDPAEVEVPKATMTASASATGFGWVPANTLNGLSTDPGWNNPIYTEQPSWLRVDLGASKTVSRVAYTPRVMSGNWLDGTHNGVFWKYEIYVTDDASGTPANWGAPVAVGEWRWPNLQERREVTFEPKAGRYVYFRRVTAWGWYGPQDPNYAAYGYPGYANANEVGVWEQTDERGRAIDTDHDGVADYQEDSNGDGAVNAGETDAANPSSDSTGVLDGEGRAGIPLTWLQFYVGYGQLDYTVQGRSKDLDDVTANVDWSRPNGGSLKHTWRSAETSAPSPDHSATNTYPERQDGPFLWEWCRDGYSKDMGALPNQPDTAAVYHRKMTSHISLSSGGREWPKPRRSVLLQVGAVDKSSGETLPRAVCGQTIEPNLQLAGVPVDTIPHDLRVGGQRVDPSGFVMVQVTPGGGDANATPTISPQIDWFYCNISPMPHRIVRMSWSKHPQLAGGLNVQEAFDQGAKQLLALDQDAPRRDGTPGLDEIEDDVNTYLEFIVIKAKRSVFPGRNGRPKGDAGILPAAPCLPSTPELF
jgi:hypothetical protein